MSGLTKFIIGMGVLIVIAIFGPAIVGLVYMIFQGGHP